MLNSHQQIAVDHTFWPLLILAGAGAGKTHTLTERVARMISQDCVRPESILCVTFTNKASKEMRERIAHKLGIENPPTNPFRRAGMPMVGTFHSTGVFFLRMFADRIGYDTNFTIMDEDDKIRTIKSILEDKKIDDKETNPRMIASMISGAKNEGMNAETYLKHADSYVKSVVGDVFREYEKRTKSMNTFDFDDILLKMLDLVANPEVLEYFHRRFEFLMVDEYQDTNEIQYRIVKALASKERNIAVVGDDWQGIYSWRGANIKNILSFEKDYPDATVVKLEQNYRSTKTIIAAANAVVKHNAQALDKTLWTDNEQGEKITMIETNDEKEEAREVADRIAEGVRSGASYSDYAVLYRTNGQSRLIEEGLIRKNIPYRVYGGVKFYERKEIKDILCYLRIIYNPSDTVSFRRIVNVPSRKLGDKSVDGIVAYMAQMNATFSEAIRSVDDASEVGSAAKKSFAVFLNLYEALSAYASTHSVRETMEYVIKTIAYTEYLQGEYSMEEAEERLDNLKEFANMASRYDGMESKEALALFLEDIALITDSDRDEAGQDVVSLMTIHLSKGLEFPRVIIPGAEEGLFPHSRSLLEVSAIEEERRLMYVAMTRAKRELTILRARERYTFGNYSANPKSRFLKEIPEEFMEVRARESDFRFSSFGATSSFGSFGGGTTAGSTGIGSIGGFGSGFASAPSAPKREARTNDPSEFHLGCRVKHAQFGEGVVVSLKDDIGEIAFSSGPYRGIKKMNIRIAPVEKLA